jgi:CrcB protein
MTFLWVAIAGAMGAPARFLLDAWVQHRTDRIFPWGTFVINTSGSLILGFVTGLVLYHGLPNTPRLLIGTGFCGAYTTFSTFTLESVRLAEDRAVPAAFGNVLGSMVAGLLGAALGLVLAAAV